MSSVFLFGAGASKGSLDCHPYSPPLGFELFPDLQKAGGVAATVEETLANIFIKENFEAGMAEFIETRNTDITALLREMSAYFVQFIPGENNL
jgi:hypothetical protein